MAIGNALSYAIYFYVYEKNKGTFQNPVDSEFFVLIGNCRSHHISFCQPFLDAPNKAGLVEIGQNILRNAEGNSGKVRAAISVERT